MRLDHLLSKEHVSLLAITRNNVQLIDRKSTIGPHTLRILIGSGIERSSCKARFILLLFSKNLVLPVEFIAPQDEISTELIFDN